MQGCPPGPSGLPQDTPEPRLSVLHPCSIWTAPNGPSCPSLRRQAQQKQEQFLLPEIGSCEGSTLPQQGQGQPAAPVPPIHGEPVPGSVLAGARSADGPGAAAGAEAEACPVSISPCMGEEEDVSHPEPGALQQCHFWVPQAPLGPGWALELSPLATTLSSPRRCSFSTRFQLKVLLLPGGPCWPLATGGSQCWGSWQCSEGAHHDPVPGARWESRPSRSLRSPLGVPGGPGPSASVGGVSSGEGLQRLSPSKGPQEGTTA